MRRHPWLLSATVFLWAWAVTWSLAAGAAPPVKPAPPAAAAPEAVEITFLHINDPHGQLEPYLLQSKSVGGYARLATLAGDVRRTSKAARVFLLHAGDEFSRGDDLTRATLGAANIAVMNHLKFDAWTPGNGDFYDGPAALLDRISEAQFPVLAANVRFKDPDEAVGKPYVIEKAGPVRVAILGLCWLQPEDDSFASYKAADHVETARRLVPELRRQADVVVALTHLGRIFDKQLAETVAGIDVILGGHSHAAMAAGQRTKGPDGREVLIAQAGEQLMYLGRVDLKLAREGAAWRVASSSAALVPLDDKVKLDPTVTALIARLAEKAAKAAAPAEKPAAAVPKG